MLSMTVFFDFFFHFFFICSYPFNAPCPHLLTFYCCIFLLQALLKDCLWIIQLVLVIMQLDGQVQQICDLLLRGFMTAWLPVLQGVYKVYSVALPLFPSPPLLGAALSLLIPRTQHIS